MLPGPTFTTPSDFNGFAFNGASTFVNITTGFVSQVNFIYVSLNATATVEVYGGYNGSGVLLGSTVLAPNAIGCPAYNAIRCPFNYGLVNFAGSGRSIKFTSAELDPNVRDVIFDDLTISVPEPASWALMIAGFGMVGGALRRRRTGVAAA